MIIKLRMNKLNCWLMLCAFIICACTNHTSRESEIEKCINKEVALNMFNTVQFKGENISFDMLRHKYKYISIVYLREGCKPCYPKYVKWNNKMDSIGVEVNHTVLFIIQATAYDYFISQVKKLNCTKDLFYTVLDKRFEFVAKNDFMSSWILDQSILIDSENQIRMIGCPFATPQMTALYRKICSQ